MSSTAAAEKKTGFDLKSLLVDKLRMLVFVLILGSVSAALLVYLEGYTMAMVERNAELAYKASILKAFNLDTAGSSIDEVFENIITSEEIDGKTFYRDVDGNVAFRFDGPGLWGPIAGILALRPDLMSIEGMTILEQQETPGLGGRIAEEWFQTQFRGVEVDPQLVILPSSRTASNPNEVDGITGASMTGEFLTDMLNRSIANARKLLEVE